jgi:hypothetical protein
MLTGETFFKEMFILQPDERFSGRLSGGLRNFGLSISMSPRLVSQVGFGNINQKLEYASAKIVNHKKDVGLNLKPVISSRKSDVNQVSQIPLFRMVDGYKIVRGEALVSTYVARHYQRLTTIPRNPTPSLKRTARIHRILTHHALPKCPQNASTIGGVIR